MQKVMDAMGFAVVIVQEEVFCDVNPAAAAISGYAREELIGKRFWEIVHPEYRDEVKATGFLYQSEKIAPQSREIKIICKDGRETWLLAIVSSTEINGKPAAAAALVEMPARNVLESRLQFADRDITAAQKEAEAVRENYQMQIEAIFNGVSDAIATVDPGMHILQCNDAFMIHSGMTEPPLNLTLQKLPISCSRACHDAIRETLASGRTVREYRVACERIDKPAQVTVINSSPLKDRLGSFIGALVVIRDITAIAQLEQRLGERTAYRRIVGNSPGWMNSSSISTASPIRTRRS